MDENEERVPPIINPAIDYNISPEENEGNCAFLLEKARIEYFAGNFIDCFRTYSNYFELLIEPNSAPENIQDQYIYCVLKLGEIEQNRNNNFLETIYYYLQAINLKLNNCYLVLNALGVCLLKEGQTKSAKLYFEEALKLKPDFFIAAQNLHELRFNKSSRQRCRVNDNLENEIYLNAVLNAINDKNVKTMLEIYSGSGFISHYISKHVKNISVTALEPHSQFFKISKDILDDCDVDLKCSNLKQFKDKKSFDLIITQLFNDFIFDECILDDLIALNSKFSNQFTVIPNEFELFATAIQCDDLIKSKKLLNFIPELKLVDICVKCNNFSLKPENLFLVNENVQYITRSASIFKSKLKNANFFKTIKDTNLSGNSFGADLCLKVLQDGIIHAFAVWIDLNLYKDFNITNNPKSEKQPKIARQTIYYLNHPIFVRAGQNLEIKVEFSRCELKFHIDNFPNKYCHCLRVQQHLIAFLNDVKLIHVYKKLANYMMKNKFKKVLESTNFPLVSLIMAKNGLKIYYKPTLITDLTFLDYVIELNQINRDNFVIFDKTDEFPSEFDVEITEPIFIQNSFEILNKNKSYLFPCKLSFPQKVVLQFVLISSPFMGEAIIQESLNETQFRKISSVGSIQLQKESFTETVDLKMLETCRISGIYYWFEMEYFKNIEYSTLNSTYYKKNCVFLENSSIFEINSILSININYSAGGNLEFQIK